ncbi:MAG: hypothetical protein WAM13_00935, partial [Candidatus Sulfotelmatobacter sp.]
LTALPAPEAPVIPPEAAIQAAEATTKSQTCQQGVVNEVKVRGGKGVLNGTPFPYLLRGREPSGVFYVPSLLTDYTEP